MGIAANDRCIVRWAERNGLRYYYLPDRPTGPTFLRVHLGHVTAEFGLGKLERLSVCTDGRCLDDAFCELARLFDFCRLAAAYPKPPPTP